MKIAWQVRAATPDDAAGIVAVFNPIIATGRFTSFTTPFSAEAERAYIESQGSRDIFHVAVEPESGAIVGFQSMSPFPAATDAFAHNIDNLSVTELHFRAPGWRAARINHLP